MNRRISVLMLLLACAFAVASAGLQQHSSNASGCALVQDALQSYHNLKPGITRQQVEKDFEPVGLSFRNEGVFAFKNCDFIKVKIVFKPDPSIQRGFSPTDSIITISQLYIEYETKD